MKNRTIVRRFGAMATAFMLTLSLVATPAFAAGGDGENGETPAVTESGETSGVPVGTVSVGTGKNTFRVDNATRNAEYKLYKLLELEATPGEDGGIAAYRYSYPAGIATEIQTLVEQGTFAYSETTGYGFKAANGNVVFLTPEDETDEAGNVTVSHRDDAKVKAMMSAFADELRKQVVDTNKLTVLGTVKAADAEGGNVSFTGVPDGYFMVTSNAGARSILFTTPGESGGETVSMTEKNPAPTIGKQVFDDEDVDGTAGEDAYGNPIGSWQSANDAKIGDDVHFKITVNLFNGAENISIHDDMGAGLTFKQIDGIKFYPRNTDGTDGRLVYELGGKDTTSELELTGNADVYTASSTDHGFVLTFTNSFTNPAAGADNRSETDPKNNAFLGDLSTLADDGGRVEIEYTATLNANAVVGSEGNKNESYVKYGHVPGVNPGDSPHDDPPGETPKEETKTYTYTFGIDKFVTGSEGTKLEGAEFKIYRAIVGIGKTESADWSNAWISDGALKLPEDYSIDDAELLKFVDETPTTEGYKGGKVYRVDPAGTIETLETDKSGQITINGLDADLYFIEESKAPSGYNEMEGKLMLVIGSAFSGNGGIVFKADLNAQPAGGNYTISKLTDKNNADSALVPVPNASGLRMPETGGMGTTVIYIAGGALVLLAAAVLVVKKRTGRSEG